MPRESLDAIDIEIIRCLQEDARTPVAQIADRLNLPESTARHRLNKLIANRVIEFAVLANPYQYSPVCAHFDIRVERTKIEAVANMIAKSKHIYFVAITLGTYELMATGFFQSMDQLFEFSTKTLSKMSGIESVNTSLVVNVVKRSRMFDFSDEGLVAQSAEGAAARNV
jgi:Lrp/AsnC family transcriptional regulator for asnA, asnC and gidA